MKTKNLVFILSDEHQACAMSCAGHPIVRTPNIDRLAARGTRFTAAYTPCPICVPARASLATGRYVHDIRYWDNAMGYDGRVPGWGVRLQATNVQVESIGKLHYANAGDPTGFDRQHHPMHLAEGVGQVWGSVRDPIPGARDDIVRFGEVGAGYSSYNSYDETIRDAAVAWLRRASRDERLWMLFIGFVAPHFPLIAPQRFVDLYPPAAMSLPKLTLRNGYVRHPWLDAEESFMPTDVEFGLDDAKRRRAISAYYALCTMMDGHVGAICAALEETGVAETTSVIYTSDHGEALGERGHWGKSNLYGECTQVPLVMAGPDVPRAATCDTPVNLIDLAPTFSPPSVLTNRVFPAARCSRSPASPQTRRARPSPSTTPSAPRPAHSCCARAGGNITSMSATRPSCSMSPPTRRRRSTGRTIRPALTSSRRCAPSCDASSILSPLTGRPRQTNARWSNALADAKLPLGWGRKAPRQPRRWRGLISARGDHKLLIVPHRTLDAGGNRS
jgi:choline-sulfatase